jgi:hypothetical protein
VIAHLGGWTLRTSWQSDSPFFSFIPKFVPSLYVVSYHSVPSAFVYFDHLRPLWVFTWALSAESRKSLLLYYDDNPLKPICSDSYMPPFPLSYLCHFAASLLSLYCAHLSLISRTTRTCLRVALFLGIIPALSTISSSPNLCILIARYFVSRNLSFQYVLYYLARLDSSHISGNQCTFITTARPRSPSSLHRQNPL